MPRTVTLRAPFICKSCLSVGWRLEVRRACSTPPQRPQKPPRKTEVPDGPARTRFAPSPTGYLHLGSLRTALFNYLIAKRTGGQFLLRIEDTDQKRTVPDAEKRLFDDLRWAGLEWDEGPEVGGPYGPYKQSQRTALYRQHAHKLLDSGYAYRCFCTPQRLSELAEHRAKLGLPTDYDRTCANVPKEESDDRASQGEKHVVRLRVPDRYPPFFDLVYGSVGKGLKPATNPKDDAYDDPILLKSDGLPTYHLANVVDDHHMKITHVIRGTEWLPSTPKHLAMYQAFGWQPPNFAHVGLLVDINGNKLSKRNMDIDVSAYRRYLPEAVNNFVALLGWSHRNRSDVMSMEELIKNFTLKFTTGSVVVTEAKLSYLQNHHQQKHLVPGDPYFEKVVDELVTLIEEDRKIKVDEHLLTDGGLRARVSDVLRIDNKNFTKTEGFIEEHDYFFSDAAIGNSSTEVAHEQLEAVKTAWQKTFFQIQPEGWTKESLRQAIEESANALAESRAKDVADEEKGKAKKEAKKETWQHLRQALSGGKHGPGVLDTLLVLGYDVCTRRMQKYLS
ncbi:glutamyl-tRNA synthetase-like protein [Phyllosticta citriasiana]|uniref:glutamate--tRNA ligase n=1 Tax=Phyllosticta citriasiana TaxID=595635 RepID=A0ABR1KAP2_9PEZI